MKKVLIAGAVFFAAAIVVSCTKREYTCVCTYTDRYANTPSTQETIVKGQTINEARNACYAHGSYLKAYAQSGDVPCYVR